MIRDELRVFDGFDGLAGGQDSGRRPSLLEKNQCERAENMVFRGGAPTTRPGIPHLTAVYENGINYNSGGGLSAGNSTQAAFETGKFQTCSYYSVPDLECLMASIGGRLFQIVPKEITCEVTEVALTLRNRSTLPLAYMVQADQNHITQDGEGAPIIFDGVTARRAGADEIFTGTIMAYGMGRIVLIVGRRIYFGDLFDSKGNGADDCLKFTETQFLNEGFASALPSGMGRPTGAAFFAQQDTSTGTGELMVFGENGAESFFLSFPREQWKDSPFQRTALLDTGAQGHRAIIPVNEDLWFRAADGWRSYRQARAQVNFWSQIPMSTAVRPYTDNDTESLLEYGSAIHFDNRLIVTCTPQPNSGRLYHNGMLSLDFDVLSSFGQASRPSWDGHWHGLRVLQLVNGKFRGRERAFAFGLDANDKNALFEITKEGVLDFSGPIPWELRGRSMDFESQMNEKELFGLDLWLDDVRVREVDKPKITVTYRADQKPEYVPWGTMEGFSSIGNAGAITPGGVPTLRAGYNSRKSLGIPPDLCDETNGRLMRRGFEFQPRLTGKGHYCIRKLRLHAKQVTENPDADCN